MTINKDLQLESGTYEIIRGRLQKQATELNHRLGQLDEARREVFGSIDLQLIANERINTDNRCIARDIIAIGDHCIFGYNVHIGLRSGIQLSDVFSIYQFEKNTFKEIGLSMLNDEQFMTDFQNLYRYYKQAWFARFVRQGTYLYMVFNISEEGGDFKAFKWLVKDEELVYVDNRSDKEVKYPEQYEFQWSLASRDHHRMGKHPHVSIMDRVFVETVGGDLTIKVEDNTEDGLGIYREEVEHTDQTMDDAEYYYADLGNLIVLKIRPYQEDYRYFVYNEKVQEVQRIDTLASSGVLLPDQHGLIFSNGYYLQTGEYKVFDNDMKSQRFLTRLSSPNGEDFVYVFYDNDRGVYVLMQYNLIQQKAQNPVICNGYTYFPNGELCYFRTEEEAGKHHVVQIWQTPFVSGELLPSSHKDHYLFKVGNKDIVKLMAECNEILVLSDKDDSYSGLYSDLVKKSTDILDAYYWIDKEEAFRLDEALIEIRAIADSAIEEYEKKEQVRKTTVAEVAKVEEIATTLFDKCKKEDFENVNQFVVVLSELRVLRGELISLQERRYADQELLKELETQTIANSDQLSTDCVHFLLQEESLKPYRLQVDKLEKQVDQLESGKAAKQLALDLDHTAGELELLIEVVGNLKIEDATETTKIVDHISNLFARLNQVKARAKRKQKTLVDEESVAQFNAQVKLFDQGIINYLDIADSPDKCDDYLTRLMVQLEELEGKFAEFNDFILIITDKREEVVSAFETRKNSLREAQNNRTTALQKTADRILQGIRKRVKTIKVVSEINGFFASDLMVDKLRDIANQLTDLDDSNKADGLRTQLKSLREEAIRQLRDEQELYVDGARILRLGQHRFSVNVQPLDLTVVNDEGQMKFHLSGTDFYQAIEDETFLATKPIWGQSLLSENANIYRAEYLAYELLRSADHEQLRSSKSALLNSVRQQAATRYQEGYTKGVHDEDAAKILEALLTMSAQIGLLAYPPAVRACATLLWNRLLEQEIKLPLQLQLNSARAILSVFPESKEYDYLLEELETVVQSTLEAYALFSDLQSAEIARYLFEEQSRQDGFSLSKSAVDLREGFLAQLKSSRSLKKFRESLDSLAAYPAQQYHLLLQWLTAYVKQQGASSLTSSLEETAVLLLLDQVVAEQVIPHATQVDLEGMHGTHTCIVDGVYTLDFHDFFQKMDQYRQQGVPLYQQFIQQKQNLAADFRRSLRLEDFRPRVLTSFVRNKLIDQVYLPLIGDNLAKQLGTVGEETRTDRMGMLLLISPPGYGKTTLMEYIANRLGLIFMKINGPTLGHRVHSLDPADAPTRAAAQELQKLNLALEMGDNVMLYVDDIQHCDPEFLQQFISLCDAQRRIEGVYDGESRSYDLRGKRFCVVMAGNPYTESGEQFRIPDMLANRSDIYNLGDIIGDSEEVFELSYLENSLTSNPLLRRLSGKSLKDVYQLIDYTSKERRGELELEATHTPGELNEYVQVLEKLLRIRECIVQVNQAYIQSAGMAEDYRTEPPFRLQGSYRDMNKLAEKVVPIMNEEELMTLLLSHYEGESQTLTSDAEANLLKLKELLGILSPKEQTRWTEIKLTFSRNQRFGKGDSEESLAQLLTQLTELTSGVEGIREVLRKSRKMKVGTKIESNGRE